MTIPKKTPLSYRFFFLILAILLGSFFLSMVGSLTTGERIVVLRHFLFGFVGLVAFILPYISFPEKSSHFFQLLNLPAASLFRLYITGHSYIWAIASFLVLVIVWGGNSLTSSEIVEALTICLYGVFFIIGIYLYSAIQYLRTGSNSQEYQEGDKGRKVQILMSRAWKVPVHQGAVPSLLLSIEVSAIGMSGVVLGAYLHSLFGVYGELLIAIILVFLAWARFLNIRNKVDMHFYHTNSFFNEFFGFGQSTTGNREPIKVDHLWWIPSRWKAHSWGFMLTLDRSLPAGRLIALGHLFLWVLVYQIRDEIVLWSVWACFAISHHLLLLITTNTSKLPAWWLRHLDSSANWMLTGFWVQVRWVLPYMLSLVMMHLIFRVFSWPVIVGLGLTYLGSGMIISGIIHISFKKRWVV